VRIFSTSEQATEAAIFSCLNRRLTRTSKLGAWSLGRREEPFFAGKYLDDAQDHKGDFTFS